MRSLYLRLSIHEGCNLRCTYCRPTCDVRLIENPTGLTAAAIIELIECIHQVAPIAKLRLTGGEPLLRPDVVELVNRARRLLPAAELCLTTNGTLLGHLASDLRSAGLDRINLSLDTFDPVKYAALTRGGDVERVLAGLKAARRTFFDKVKLNAVLLRSFNGGSLPEMVRRAAELVGEIRFIELMPISVAAGLHRREFLPASVAADILGQAFGPLAPLASSQTAQRFALEVDGRELVVGFIPSVSEPFCDRCDRLRLDSRGRLYACLRHQDFLDLAKPLASGDRTELARRVRRVAAAKCPPESIWPGRQMSAIGG